MMESFLKPLETLMPLEFAEPTDEVVAELRQKYPKRTEEERWPQIQEIMEELKILTILHRPEKPKPCGEDFKKKNNPQCENDPLSKTNDEDEMETDIADGEDHSTTTDTLEQKEAKESKPLLE